MSQQSQPTVRERDRRVPRLNLSSSATLEYRTILQPYHCRYLSVHAADGHDQQRLRFAALSQALSRTVEIVFERHKTSGTTIKHMLSLRSIQPEGSGFEPSKFYPLQTPP